MTVDTETESFAYGSSMYGGRPTFALTRRLSDDAGLTLYEFVPQSLADARQKRLRSANASRKLTRVSIIEAIPDINTKSGGTLDFSQTGAPSSHAPSNWEWDDWCGLKIATLSDGRQQAVHELVRETMNKDEIDASFVTRGEGSVMLSEGTGVRVTIAFLTMKRLQKYQKLIAVADGIRRMSVEECYYWHAKCRSPSSPNGIKALRVLLADNQ